MCWGRAKQFLKDILFNSTQSVFTEHLPHPGLAERSWGYSETQDRYLIQTDISTVLSESEKPPDKGSLECCGNKEEARGIQAWGVREGFANRWCL